MKNRFLQFFIAILVVLFFGCSTSSDGNGNSTTTVVPLAPTGLTGTVASATQINLSWTDNSTNETGFKIERRTGSANYAVVGTVNADVLAFSDTGLTPNTTYIYRVYAFNAVGNSLTYSNEVTVTTTANVAQLPNVTIGTQIWQSTNLDVTSYRDGTPIPQVTNPTQWANLTTGAWCYYNNDPINGTTYGKLYNWYAVAGIHDTDPSTPNKILAPTGWHVPSDSEWTTLTNFLGGESVAGGKMKSTGTSLWQIPNTAATNESGFLGLPGGYHSSDGEFIEVGYSGIWWSSSEDSTTNAWSRGLNFSNSYAFRSGYHKNYGWSVRCIKD